MASFAIKHKFVSPKPDGSETDLLRPSDWNAEHDFELTGSGAVARLGTGTGPAQFVPFGTGASEIPLNSHLGDAAYATLGNAVGNAVQVIDVGGGVAGLPTLDGRNITNLPLDEDGPLPKASLTEEGIVQLSSATDSSSEVLAATPKAVSSVKDYVDGKNFAEQYSGTNRDLVNYPIGSVILVSGSGGSRNGNRSVKISTSGSHTTGFHTRSSGVPSTTELSGTWRNRGQYLNIDGGGTATLVNPPLQLLQRVS